MSSSSKKDSESSPASPMNTDRYPSEDSDGSSVFEAPPFNLHQKVLCRDKNNDTHYYEAKVCKVKCISEHEWSFYVHYLGWNSRWDRWATKDDLVDDTEENRKTYLKPKETKKRKKDSETSPNRKRKAPTEATAKKQIAKYEDYCDLPFTLKTVMVDEYEKITRKGYDSPHFYDCDPSPRPARSVHVLPATVTVQQALQQYQKKRGGATEDKTKQEAVRRFCEGLTLVFDDALPVCLLYAEERPQYEFILQDSAFKSKRPSEIYGCEFLLRLMVRLPTLLLAEPKAGMEVMGPLIADLIVLLQKNRQACFKGKYREPKYCELLDWEKALADRKNLSSDNGSASSKKSTSEMKMKIDSN